MSKQRVVASAPCKVHSFTVTAPGFCRSPASSGGSRLLNKRLNLFAH
jgi:hypothetical protein